MSARQVMLMTRTLGHGGTERQLTEIAVSLNREIVQPHVCCVETSGPRAEQLRAAGVPILQIPMHSLMGRECLAGILALRRYIRAHEIALLHTFDSPMNVLGLMTRFTRPHGNPVLLSSQRCHENVIWGPYRRPTRMAHRRADGVVVNCIAMRDHLLNDYKIPARNIHICPNGLDTSVFKPGPRTIPEGLEDAGFVIGCVCVLRPEKSLRTLVEAFAIARPARPGMKLVIVGNGPERPLLEARAAELSLTGHCHFFPGTTDVPYWLRAMDLFVLPSVSEAFSNSLMEAMGCGCCAVASNVGGNPELVVHEKTGLLFEPGNADDLARQLRRLARDHELRTGLAKAGADWVAANLSQAAAARRMEEIYLSY